MLLLYINDGYSYWVDMSVLDFFIMAKYLNGTDRTSCNNVLTLKN